MLLSNLQSFLFSGILPPIFLICAARFSPEPHDQPPKKSAKSTKWLKQLENSKPYDSNFFSGLAPGAKQNWATITKKFFFIKKFLRCKTKKILKKQSPNSKYEKCCTRQQNVRNIFCAIWMTQVIQKSYVEQGFRLILQMAIKSGFLSGFLVSQWLKWQIFLKKIFAGLIIIAPRKLHVLKAFSGTLTFSVMNGRPYCKYN